MADKDFRFDLIANEAVPVAHGPKLAFHVQDVEAYEAWCKANNWTLEEHAAHLTRLLTPGSWE